MSPSSSSSPLSSRSPGARRLQSSPPIPTLRRCAVALPSFSSSFSSSPFFPSSPLLALALLGAACATVGCGAPPDAASASSTMAADDDPADASAAHEHGPVIVRLRDDGPDASPSAPQRDHGGPCVSDFDCQSGDLCVEGACRQACLSSTPTQCADGSECVMAANSLGGCYNMHGCNPPPPGAVCPTLCFGYCP